jgi:hypothetical protein
VFPLGVPPRSTTSAPDPMASTTIVIEVAMTVASGRTID